MENNQRAISPIKFAHAVFQTAKFEEMKSWYCTVLNAHVVFENEMIAFLTYDDEHHRLAFINMPGLQPRGHTAGLAHLAYTYANLKDLFGTYERLKEAGITPVWSVNHGPTTSMYYRDPDGNQVELQIDNFPTVEELNGWFRSGKFKENPIGVNFNPDELVRKYHSGEPVLEMLRQGAV